MSTGVLARRYDENDDPNDGYTDSKPNGGDSIDGDPASASASASAGTPLDTHADAGTGIQWISPVSGSSVQSGQSLLVTWRTDVPIDSAGFALCTATSTSTSCGKQSYPYINDQNDGTFSTTLMMPAIPQSQAQSLYLELTSASGEVYHSPNFIIAGQSSRNAYIASTTDVDSVASQTQTFAGIATSSTVTWGSVRGSMTRTMSMSMSMSSAPMAAASQSYSYIGSNSYPTPTPQAQVQIPLIATAIPPPASASAESQSSASAGILQAHASQPKITAIALPLTLCGLILLSALIFCARSKALRGTGHKRGGKDDEENDWQAVVKEKAAASAAAASVKGSKGAQVIKRNDPSERERQRRSRTSTADHGSRSRSPPPYTTKSRKEDKFTSIPEIKIIGRHSSSEYSDNHNDQHSHHKSRETRSEKERDSKRHRSREGYYSTTRRSSSALGGIYDHPQVHLETYDRSRSRVDSHDGYDYEYEVDRTRGPSACAYHHEQLWRAREHDHWKKSSRNPQHDNSACEGCERDSNTIIQAANVLRPQPRQADSFGPLTNPHPPSQDVRQAQTDTEAVEAGIRRTYTNRPLPLPIIRTSSTSYSERYKAPTESEAFDFEYAQRGKSIIGQEYQPHLTGALALDPHEHDWELELANQGRYTSGEEGMEELYDSLRRAIATS